MTDAHADGSGSGPSDGPSDREPGASDREPGGPELVDADRAAAIGRSKPRQIDTRVVHAGRVVHLSMDSVRFPDGSTGELELVRHSGASAVVPVLGSLDDPDPEIVLLRQFRYAAGGDIYEIPAGRPDHQGEPWEDVARRELEEETGYVAGSLRRLNTIYTTPGFTDERIHTFLATDLSRGTTNLDRDEFVQVITLPCSKVLQAIQDGRIIDAKSVAGVLFFARFAQEI